MKTSNIMKNLHVISLVLIIGLLMPVFTLAQDSGNKDLKLKIVKDVNGHKTVVDTTVTLSAVAGEDEIQKLKELLGSEAFKSYGINPGDLDNLKNVYLLNSDDADNKGFYMVTKDVETDENGNESVELIVSKGDDEMNDNAFAISGDDDSYTYFFSGDGDSSTVSCSGDKSMVIHSFNSKDGHQTYAISSNPDWKGAGSTHVEVVSNEDGNLITVTQEDGTVKEYQVDEPGAYIIDEDGNIKKAEGDGIDRNETGNGLYWVKVGDDGDHSTIVVKHVGGDDTTVGSADDDEQVWIVSDDDTGGESQVIVKTRKSKNNEKEVIVEKKVIIKKLNNDELKTFENKGIALEEKDNSLEIDHLSFNPNPTTGKFILEFETPGTGTTSIGIYDVNGRQVYKETLQNFDGNYKKEIDISSEKNGVYFLNIRQGEKLSTRKIVLE